MINTGYHSEEETFYTMLFNQVVQPSFFTEYPKLYKFSGLQINTSTKMNMIDRRTFDLMDMFGDVGGVTSIIMLLGSWVTKGFADLTMKSMTLEKLYSKGLPEGREITD